MKRITALWSVAIVLTWAVPARASPLFSIGEGSSTNWTAAMSNINAINGSQTQAVLENFLIANTGATSVQGMTPVLTPDVPAQDVNGLEIASLVMSWGEPQGSGQMDLSAAGWEYVYGVDPDLNGTLIEFSLNAPPGIWDVVIALRDDTGDRRKWLMSAPPNLWTDLVIDPTVTGPQGGFNFFMDDVGFDLSRVIAIELYEAGNPVAAFDPSGELLGVWNAWDHLRVREVTTPEPAPAALGVLAVLVFAALAMRRRERA